MGWEANSELESAVVMFKAAVAADDTVAVVVGTHDPVIPSKCLTGAALPLGKYTSSDDKLHPCPTAEEAPMRHVWT